MNRQWSVLTWILFGVILCPSVLSAAPDRDLGMHLRAGDKGMGVSVFLTDTLGLELGFSANIMSDKSFELDGFTPFAEGSYGIRFGPMLAAFWERTALTKLWHPQDELSLRLAARWRPQKLYQIEARAVSFLELITEMDVQHGTVQSLPVTAGVAYTFWLRPWGEIDSWWSQLLDFGVVFRLEVGPDFADYDLEKLPFMAAGTEVLVGEKTRVQESKVEVYWNFQIGLIL